MRNKKAPSLAAVGAGKKGGKVRDLACPHSATPPRSSQSECCSCCQFFRIVALASGHDRKLCMMTGEKLRTAAGWCDLFAAGKWEETWADPAPAPRQSWLCRVCRHGIVPSFRAAIIGLVGCRSHYLPDGRGWPVLCPGFKVKEGCHAA